MTEERRRAVRTPIRLVTFVKMLSTGKVRRVLTNNVSVVGLCFLDEALLEPGVQLEIEVKLPDREAPIPCTAEVVWSRSVGGPRKSYEALAVETGVKVVEIQPKDQRLLQAYIAMNTLLPSSGGT